MRHSFWNRPIPRWAKWLLLGGGGALLAAALLLLVLWIQFHRAYEHWLNTPPERLVGYPTRLILDGLEQSPAVRSDIEAQIDASLIAQRDDLATVVEMSRSDVLTYQLLGLAYVKVFLHTRAQDGSSEQRIEFVAEFRRRGDGWLHQETRNLALP